MGTELIVDLVSTIVGSHLLRLTAQIINGVSAIARTMTIKLALEKAFPISMEVLPRTITRVIRISRTEVLSRGLSCPKSSSRSSTALAKVVKRKTLGDAHSL